MKVLSLEERMSWTSYEQRSFSLPHPFRKKAGKSWEKKRRLEDSSDRTVSNNNLYSLRTHLNDNRSSLSTFASSRQLQESKWKVYTRSQDGATFYGLDSVEDAHSCIESDKRISLFGGSRDLPDFYGGSASNPQGNPAPKNPEINLLDKYSEANRAGDIPKFFSEEKLISSSKLNDNSIDNFLQLGKSIDTLLELDKHRNQQRRDSNNLQSNHINNNNKNEGTSKVDNNNVVVDVSLHPCGVCCCCYQKRLNNPPPNKLVRERNAYNKNHRSSTCSVGDWPMKLEPLWECSIGGCGRCYTCAAGHPARCLDFLRIDTTLQRQTSWTPESKVVNWYDRKRRPPSCPQVQAHMVAAFEQSLSNMTTRLQHLTASAEQKDSELMELRTTIEALKKQSAEAGLTKAALQSMQAVQRSTPSPAPITNITSAPQLVRRHTFNTTKDSALQEHRISRQLSTDSVSSVNSVSSATSTASKSGDDANKKKKSKKGWLRSSFSKAFSRSKKNRHGSVSDVEDPPKYTYT